jgi:protease IV
MFFLLCFSSTGCIAPQVTLFTDASDPLKEYRLSGTHKGKVLVIPVKGVISDEMEEQMLRSKPGIVQEVVSQLDLARKDSEVAAVLLKIDSPGGSVTASDILYHEISKFKEETSIKVVVSMMNFAASGGYYISLPADYIVAHPTTVTGSIGVVFIRPNIDALMQKIGVDVKVDVSGEFKDMGSILRPSTEEEDILFETLIGTLGDRFIGKVVKHRELSEEALKDIKTARIFLADEAMAAGLVDEVGYLDNALAKAKELAGLHKDSKVVVYRRSEFANDNIYNPVLMNAGPGKASLVDLGLPRHMTRNLSGFYYLWVPGLETN